MKNLSFRIWDGRSYHYPESTPSIGIDSDGHSYVRFGLLFVKTVLRSRGIIIQLSTIKRDSKNREIFVGDIIRAETVNDGTEFYAEVKFNENEGFFIDSTTNIHDKIIYDGGVSLGKDVTVVGNVFENPELQVKCDPMSKK